MEYIQKEMRQHFENFGHKVADNSDLFVSHGMARIAWNGRYVTKYTSVTEGIPGTTKLHRDAGPLGPTTAPGYTSHLNMAKASPFSKIPDH